MSRDEIAIREAAPPDSDLCELMAELDAELHGLYPGDSVHGLGSAELRRFSGVLVVAALDGRPVGCGALRPLGDGLCEVKRMFVRRSARGRGIGRRILGALETGARARGFHTIRLETGDRQPEAISLYESSGYVRAPCSGEYADDPHSVCFEKRLPDRGDP